MITVQQCKAARALLKWRQDHLAKAAGLGMATVADYESARREPTYYCMTSIERALREAGAVFIGLTGVDLPEKSP